MDPINFPYEIYKKYECKGIPPEKQPKPDFFPLMFR